MKKFVATFLFVFVSIFMVFSNTEVNASVDSTNETFVIDWVNLPKRYYEPGFTDYVENLPQVYGTYSTVIVSSGNAATRTLVFSQITCSWSVDWGAPGNRVSGVMSIIVGETYPNVLNSLYIMCESGIHDYRSAISPYMWFYQETMYNVSITFSQYDWDTYVMAPTLKNQIEVNPTLYSFVSSNSAYGSSYSSSNKFGDGQFWVGIYKYKSTEQTRQRLLIIYRVKMDPVSTMFESKQAKVQANFVGTQYPIQVTPDSGAVNNSYTLSGITGVTLKNPLFDYLSPGKLSITAICNNLYGGSVSVEYNYSVGNNTYTNTTSYQYGALLVDVDKNTTINFTMNCTIDFRLMGMDFAGTTTIISIPISLVS